MSTSVRRPLVLSNAALEVAFDPATGSVVSFVDTAAKQDLLVGQGSPVPIPGRGVSVFEEKGNIGGAGLEIAVEALIENLPPATLESAVNDTLDGESRLLLTIRAGDLRWTADYRIDPELPILSRRFRVENASSERQVVRSALYELPAVASGSDAEVIFAGNMPMGYQKLTGATGQIRPLDFAGYRPQHGLCYLWSAQEQRAVAGWLYSEEEYANISVEPRAGGASICHQLQVLAPLEPGQSADLAVQFLWLAKGSRDDVLSSIQPIHRKVGLRAPTNSLDRLRQKVIYCGHPGGLPEQYFTGFGGLKAMTDYVPTLKQLGVDILWIQPIFEHGDGVKHNLYSPYNHVDISPLYGTKAEALELTKTIHDQGMDIVYDVTPHGPPEGTPQALQYAHLSGRNEDGTLSDKWACLVFDYANPEWRQIMHDEIATWAGADGIAGMRIDVAGGSPPNWDPNVSWRPSHSTLNGGLLMMKALRDAVLSKRPDALLIPEEANGPDAFYKDCDVTYDFQLLFTLYRLQLDQAKPEEWVSNIKQLLHDQALTLPEGALKMRFTATHDTIFNLGMMRPHDLWGWRRARALTALCGLVEGVPMLFTGEEDPSLYERLPLADRLGKHPMLKERLSRSLEWFHRPDPSESRAQEREGSYFDFLSRIYHLRKELPALAEGGADYSGIEASDGVFSCTRGTGTDAAIVLISLADRDLTTTVSLPSSLTPPSWRDVAFTKDEFAASNGQLLVSMERGQVRVLVADRG